MLKGNYISSIDEIVDQLTVKGMAIGQIMSLVGVISGTVDETNLNLLRAVEGVSPLNWRS